MFRCAFFAFLIVLAATATYAITTDDDRRIRELITNRNYLAAFDELQQLKQAHRDKFELNNYDYLLARIAHRSGQFGVAMANYQAVATRGSVLRGYALWHLAEIARGFGNPMLERQYLRELQFTDPGSLLNAAAANRMARSHYANGDYPLAKIGFEQLLRGTGSKNSGTPDQLARENLSLLAENCLYTGDTQTARGLFSRLLNETADATQPDDFALAGAKGLDTLDSANGSFPRLSPEEHQQRAWVYQFNREFENARRHYTAIVNEHAAGRLNADALYQIGRGYSQTNEFAEAAKWYERLQEQFPETDVARDALLQLASSYARLGKYRESASRYQYFIDRFPTDERLDRAYLNMIDIARDQGEEVEALRRATNAQDVFRGKPAEAQALFAEARIYIAREEWQTAANALDRLQKLPDLGGTRLPGGTTLPEVAFLRGFVFEQLLNWPHAIDAYLSISDGRAEFYGCLATERLRALAEKPESKTAIAERRARLDQNDENLDARRRGLQDAIRLTSDENDRKGLIDELREVYAKLPEYSSFGTAEKVDSQRREILEKPTAVRRKISDELVFLGLYDEAASEIEADGNIKDVQALAQYYLLGNYADRTIKTAEPKYRLPADFQIELLPPHIAEMLYPRPFADELVQNAPGRNVDPRFLLAIMRQESRFQPTVKSNAAARGLMQFISTTSTRMAGELQLAPFRQDDLYDSSIAILMGSQYVSGLFVLYPNQPSAVAASYNGGEDNMKRWLGRAKSSSPGRYVPEIMYAQTKDYVYKVMSNYRVYQHLYSEDLRMK
jgi:soluble lytic murein transglycosylase